MAEILSEERVALTTAAWQDALRPRFDASRLLFPLLFLIALVPVAITPIPAMVDYVNHLARMYLLTAGESGTSPFYRIVWSLTPDLAMDIAVPRLARIVGVEAATRLFLLAAQVLVVTGAIAIERAVKHRHCLSGYAGLMMLSCAPFAWGFLNFEFALGLALWGIASWLALRGRTWAPRFAVHAAMCVTLFVSHLFALGLYGFVLGVHEAWAAWRGRLDARSIAVTVLMLATPAALLFALMGATGGSVGQAGTAWHLAMKPFWLFAVMNGYSVVLSTLGMLIMLALTHALAREHCLSFESSGAWIAIGLGVLYIAVPSTLLDTALVDVRVIAAALLIVPAFVTVSFPNRRWRISTSLIAAALILANVGFTTWVWMSYQSEYRAMIASFDRLDRGARILVGHSGAVQLDPPFQDLTEYPIYHAPTLATAYADAFVPTLFTTTGKQPIEVRDVDRHLADSCGGPVPTAILTAIATDRAPPGTPAFIRSWTRDFDYLYVVGAAEPNPMPDILTTMETHLRFTLYRIRKGAS